MLRAEAFASCPASACCPAPSLAVGLGHCPGGDGCQSLSESPQQSSTRPFISAHFKKCNKILFYFFPENPVLAGARQFAEQALQR